MTLKELLKLNRSRKKGILDLSGRGLTALPPEIGKLTDLTELDVSNNKLTTLPPEIGKLANLTELDVSHNQLTTLPPQIGKLTNLTDLVLYLNQLNALPPEIGKLTNLTHLSLWDNKLTALPPQIGELTNLTTLDVSHNQLTALPPQIGKLTKLTSLNLLRNHLTALPPEIGKLTKLRELYLWRNRLTALPPQIGKLTDLADLDFSNNKLTALAPEIGKLTNLTTLWFWDNQLTAVPPEIGKLTNLRKLSFAENKLTALPPEIGKLTNLTQLSLSKNKLTALPPQIGKLTKLKAFEVDDNPLTSPPPEIVSQGTKAVLAYLREQADKGEEEQWVSKLLLLGQGGVGKTHLLCNLLGVDYEEGKTVGIDIRDLPLDHPREEGITMRLNAWDFGGQDIFHATHQFFLTNRSLFLLVWDARHGWKQGRLRYWLNQIRARAPESRVILVAAHTDEAEAMLPLAVLKQEYPDQIIGSYDISNISRDGIDDLRAAIAKAAADLPLMGETWPANWLSAANAVRKRTENHITPQEYYKTLAKNDVTGESVPVLTQWLHELGDIVFFHENQELNDTVFLNPEWVTDQIYKVLDCKEIPEGTGFFERKHMKKLWSGLPKAMRDHLLRLMEQFDLSYRTLANKEISIVVERLSLDPAKYEKRWEAILGEEGCKEVAMRFELNTIPAGIPTWFIARSHRFTTRTHWRNGALLESGSHLGLIRAFSGESRNYVMLAARGPSPHNFFATLRDGFELTLGRFPGLEVRRLIPCPGHDHKPCTHLFDLADVQNAYAKQRADAQLQCPKTLDMIHVSTLLFGLDWTTQDEMMELLRKLHAESKALAAAEQGRFKVLQVQVGELKALTQRSFLLTYNEAQSSIDSACPRVFSLLPADTSTWRKKLIGQKVTLHLWCEEPGHWHPVKGANYTFTLSAKWLGVVAPWVRGLVKALKYAAPLAGPAAGIASSAAGDLKHHIKMAEELVKKLPDITEDPAESRAEALGSSDEPGRARGADFRALRDLLTHLDPKQHWGGLQKVLSPEGHYYWVCPEHADQAKYTRIAAPEIS